VSVVVDSFVVITITIEKYFNFFQTSIYRQCFIFFLMMRKKLKSFFRFFLGHSTVHFNRMQPETTENQNRKRRVILVKKSAKDAKDPKGGMERFDEYIQKSGLEPKSYQRDGVAFCLRREERCAGAVAVRGGIIADEMGLGKTIMMMGLILANLATYRRTLIVVPVALIAQWVAQLKKTIIDTGVKPDLSILVFHGATGKRSVVLSEVGDAMVWCHRPPKRGGGGGGARARAIDIVITTYGCVAMEEPASVASDAKRPLNVAVAVAVAVAKTPALSLLTFRADRVIFDEAHHLRNKTSRIFKGAMRVVAGSAGSASGASPVLELALDHPGLGATAGAHNPLDLLVIGGQDGLQL
jgi:SNF2 family DNA or RNA helicase